MKRGCLVTVALQGDVGKPRPALVIQSDMFDEHPSVVVLPVTSDLRETPLFRITVEPTKANGLQVPSQIMVDKPQSISRTKIGPPFGEVDQGTLVAVNRSLAFFLGIA
jgi:mRNA interferase MazF